MIGEDEDREEGIYRERRDGGVLRSGANLKPRVEETIVTIVFVVRSLNSNAKMMLYSA